MPVGLHESLHTKVGATHSIVAVPEITFSLLHRKLSSFRRCVLRFCIQTWLSRVPTTPLNRVVIFAPNPNHRPGVRWAMLPPRFSAWQPRLFACFAFSRGRREMGGGASGSGRWRV
jgi:hypothetical protein